MNGDQTERATVKRHPERGSYDKETIYAILDEAPICHVGFTVDGQSYVLPTIHARLGDNLYLHGAIASGMFRALAGGVPACVTATLLDGLVLARSVYHHSMNYRSAVVLGTACDVSDRDEKMRALEAFVEHVMPGRWGDARQPNEAEFLTTRVLKIRIAEASAKIRTGPPKDDAEDLELPVWAGVLPLGVRAGEPQADERAAGPVKLPDYISDYLSSQRSNAGA